MGLIVNAVYNPDGLPFEGVQITCVNLSNNSNLTGITDTFGTANFTVTDGYYRLIPGKTGYVFNPLSFDCYLLAQASVQVAFYSTYSLPPPAPPLVTQTTAESIIDRVRNHFDDINDNAYSLLLKMEWLNSAQKDLALGMPVSVLEKIIITIPNAVISSTTGYITMPDPNDFLKLVDVVYRDNPCRFIHSKNLKMVRHNFDLQDTDTMPTVFWENNNLRIKSGQYPSGSSETARLIYVKIPKKITELASVVELDNFLDLLYFYSLSQGYGKDRDNENSINYMNLYLNGIKEEWQKELSNRR